MKIIYVDVDGNLMVVMQASEWRSATATDMVNPGVGLVAEVVDMPAMERRLANAAAAINSALARPKGEK